MASRIVSLALLMLLHGCWLNSLYLWAPYKRPAPSDFRGASAQAGCPRIGVQNLDPEETVSVLQAVAEVCRIYHSEAFASAIRSRSWLASCDRPGGRPDSVSGEYVIGLLTGRIENFSVLARKPIGAVGQIDPANSRIAVRRWRVDGWRSSDPQRRKWLIDTMAHEMSHFVRKSGATAIRFRDGGHTFEKPGCPDRDLVSYSVGKLAMKIWVAEQTGR